MLLLAVAAARGQRCGGWARAAAGACVTRPAQHTPWRAAAAGGLPPRAADPDGLPRRRHRAHGVPAGAKPGGRPQPAVGELAGLASLLFRWRRQAGGAAAWLVEHRQAAIPLQDVYATWSAPCSPPGAPTHVRPRPPSLPFLSPQQLVYQQYMALAFSRLQMAGIGNVHLFQVNGDGFRNVNVRGRGGAGWGGGVGAGAPWCCDSLNQPTGLTSDPCPVLMLQLCYGHPSVSMHASIAAQLIDFLDGAVPSFAAGQAASLTRSGAVNATDAAASSSSPGDMAASGSNSTAADAPADAAPPPAQQTSAA